MTIPVDRQVPVVLHIIPTAAARGAQREARALADRLNVPGVRHHRVLSLFAGPPEVPVDESLDHAGGRRPTASGFDPRLVRRLRAAIRRIDPVVVVAHGGDPLKYLVPSLAGRHRPLVYYATGTLAHSGRPLGVALWRFLVSRADVVAAEGDEVFAECRQLLGVPAHRLVLAPNGRDPEEFRPPPTDAPSPVRPRILFVGALTAGKRPGLFVDVVATLRLRGATVDAALCGGGPLAADLVEPAARAGVKLLGMRSDVAAVLRESDVLIFPSLPTGEGMPGVLIEAGLTGIPVVATAVPGATTIVEDGVTGFVVEPGSDDGGPLVEATTRLVSDASLRTRMGAAARRRCVERFSLDAVTARWNAFLEPLVADRSAGTSGQERG